MATDSARILIVGNGKSGGRFRRVFAHLASSRQNVDIVGVCDANQTMAHELGDGIAFFTNVEDALVTARPHVVCVCVNESAHHGVLLSIARLGIDVRLVISEKPLTRTMTEFQDVEQALASLPVTVNFVERHSPAVADFRNWLSINDVDVRRVDFEWGKYRFRDSRPTMGILSEISHPLDLVRYLIDHPDTVPFNLHSAERTDSDFTCVPIALPDTVRVTYLLGDVLVHGAASFLWPSRRRQISIWLTESAGDDAYLAVLRFDDTLWDQDHLHIQRLDPHSGGARKTILERTYSNHDFPDDLFQINKVAEFVKGSLAAIDDLPLPTAVATIADARWVQSALGTIEDHANATTTPILYSSAWTTS